jgi:hypothetical protein
MKKIISSLLFIGLNVCAYTQDLENVKKELETYHNLSFEQRAGIGKIHREFGFNSPQFDSLGRLLAETDSIYLEKAVKIIEKHGWLGKSEVGIMANLGLSLIIQHGSDEARKKYFPLLKESALEGESELSYVVIMQDRILTGENKPQMYGSQYNWDEEKKAPFFYPIADIKRVRLINKRRKEVGLKSLKKAAKRLKIT